MKQPNDDKTGDMLPGGAPVYELDHEYPWTLPVARPYTPAPRELSLKEKWRMAAARKVEGGRP